MNTATQAQSPAVSTTVAPDAKPNVITIPAHVAEAKAFIAKAYALAEEGAALGNLALDEIVKALGKSGNQNKFGRPNAVLFIAYMLAMEARPLGMTRRVALAQLANAQAGFGAKPVFRVKSAASGSEGALSFKLNLPVTFEVEVN